MLWYIVKRTQRKRVMLQQAVIPDWWNKKFIDTPVFDTPE